MRDEMSVQDGIVFKGERVVVLREIRSDLMMKVYYAHLGVNECLNSHARECRYWPGMSRDVNNFVSTWGGC